MGIGIGIQNNSWKHFFFYSRVNVRPVSRVTRTKDPSVGWPDDGTRCGDDGNQSEAELRHVASRHVSSGV